MAGENAYIDENSRNTITALANDNSGDIWNVRINPITGALVVEGNVTSGNTSIGSTIPGGTAGSVLFLDIGSTLAEDNDYFYYDPIQHELSLGHNSPDATLDILGTLKYVDGNESDGYILTSDNSGNATWQDLAANTTFITNLANNTTFIDDLVANTYFTDELANDTNFYTELANNSSFTTILGGKVAVATDGVTITGDGTTGDPLTAVGAGTGTVISVSVATANGFSGTSDGDPANPEITIATTQTGLLQGNGTAISGISNSSTVGQVLRVTGASTYAWGAVDLADTDAVTGILASANGGTGNGFTKFSGATTSEKTYTLPNSSTTILTTANTVTVAQGGTGATSLTDHGVLIGRSTSAIAATSAGTAGQVLTSNGASSDPTFQTPTGSTGLFTNGTTTKNAADGSSVQTIAHGLGIIPKKVRITAMYGDNDFTNTAMTVYNGTTQSSVSMLHSPNATDVVALFSLDISTNVMNRLDGVVTFDATNITITWTAASSPTGTYKLVWEAEA